MRTRTRNRNLLQCPTLFYNALIRYKEKFHTAHSSGSKGLMNRYLHLFSFLQTSNLPEVNQKSFLNITINLHKDTPEGITPLLCIFPAEPGRGSCRHPSLCSVSRSPGCDTSFELPFIAWVAFRLDFMAGIILHFIFIACVASSCFIAYVAFSCYGMCRLHVGFFSACVAFPL